MAMPSLYGRLLSPIVLISATALVACSGSDDTVDGGNTPADSGPADAGEVADTGVTPDAGEDPVDAGTPDSGAEEMCVVDDPGDTTPDPNCSGDWLATVAGRLQLDDGTPLDDGRAQVCLRDADTDVLVCLRPEASCPDGSFEVRIPESNRCVGNMVMHSFSFNGSFADTFCDVDVAGADPRADFSNDPWVVYRTTPVANLPPVGDDTMARTVTFENNLSVEVTPERLFDGYDTLASVFLDGRPAEAPCFLGANDDYDAIWGFTPALNISGADGYPFRITDTGLTEGTMVDLFVLGGLECWLDAMPTSNVPEGEWDNYATVTVGAGGVIEGNLPCFNWFAYRAR